MSISVSGSQITFNDASTQTTAATGFGFKNRIINGACMIDQRKAGAAVTSNDSFPVDRFRLTFANSTGAFSAQQTTTAPAGFINSLKYTTTTADASLGATEYAQLQQTIEGLNCSDLGWGTANAATVTLSFWCRSSQTGTFGGSLRNSAGNRSYPFSYTVSSANTWEQKSITIAGDTSGTWLTTNGVGMYVHFGMGVGSTYSGTAGTWAAGTYLGVTGGVNLIATLNADFYITGVQLEKGSTATSFDYRPYTTELQLCQRYYEKSYNIDVVPATVTNTGAISTFPAAYAVYFPIQYKVQKRTSPTVTGYNPRTGATGSYQYNGTTDVALSGILSSGQFGACPYTGATPGNVSAYLHFTADAEL
jgi:hypothetical protein